MGGDGDFSRAGVEESGVVLITKAVMDRHSMGALDKAMQKWRNMLFAEMLERGTGVWVSLVDDITRAYTSTYSSVVGSAPDEVSDNEVQELLLLKKTESRLRSEPGQGGHSKAERRNWR